MIEEIFNRINESSPSSGERHQLLLDLVDNYKSDLILPFLIKKINEEQISELDSTLIYVCGEYSLQECVEYIDLFIEILKKSNYEAAWTSCGLISDLRGQKRPLPNRDTHHCRP